MNGNTTDIGQFKTVNGRKQWVFWIFGILLALTIIALFSDLLEAQLIQRAINGEAITEAEAVSNDTRQAIISVFYFIFLLASVVAFLMWIHRAHKNLISLGASTLRFTSGWAVGWFFIPIMSLFRPYQVVTEIWKASSPNVNMADSNSWRNIPTPPIIKLWWALFIISSYIGNFASQMFFSGEELSNLLLATYATMAWEAVDIIGIPVTILLVRKISQFQETKYKQLSYA